VALQKQYRGLQKYLGRFEAGILPLDLGQVVQPQIDIAQWVEPELLTNGQSINTGQIATPGQIADKVFIPEWMGLHVPVLAGQQAIRVEPVIVLQNTLAYGLADISKTYSAAGDYYLGIDLRGLRIGDSVGVTVVGFKFNIVAAGPILNVATFMFGRSYTV